MSTKICLAIVLCASAMWFVHGGTIFAQEEAGGETVATEDLGSADPWTMEVAVDTLWTLVAGFLVFFMNAGFGCVEAGFCRAKNAVNILGKNFVVFGIASLSFWVIGWGVTLIANQEVGEVISILSVVDSAALLSYCYWHCPHGSECGVDLTLATSPF